MKKLQFISVLVSFIFILGNLSYAQDCPTHSNSSSTLTAEEIQRNIDEYVPHVGRSNLKIPYNWVSPNSKESLLDSRGTDFWLLMMDNYSPPAPYLDITSEVNATGTVSISGIAFSEPFSVMANTVVRVNLPTDAEITTPGTIQSLGIHVESDYDVSVYGMNRVTHSTDGFLGLPVDILGTSYLAMTYSPLFAAEFAIVSPYDNNQVSITPIIGDPINVSLNQGETYMVTNAGDLTGSIVTSTLPIALFSGNQCANIPVGYQYCDHLVEQIPPVSTWGNTFVTKTLAGRLNGDTWRFLASQNGTQVMINGAAAGPVLNFGDFYETILTDNSFVSANYPILAVQFSNGTQWDGVEADPFMMVIPPYQQFLDSYSFSTPVSGFSTNYFNSAVETTSVPGMNLDGSPLSQDAYTQIGATDFSAAEFPVEINTSHNITNTSGYPSGLYLYGFGDADSYGYPGGLSLISINVGSGPVIELTTTTLNYFCTSLSSTVSLEISAIITDPEEPFVQSATLFYRNIGGANYNSLAMTESTGNIWAANIPAGDINYPGMEYYIYATDGQIGVTSPDSDPANNPYSVGVDNEPPQIVHTPVTNGTIGVDIPISANVTDVTTSVQHVKLFYRIEGGTPVYTILDMTNTIGDTYAATIPGTQMTVQGINYFIKATDNLDVSCTYGTADEPMLIQPAGGGTATLSGMVTNAVDGLPIEGALVEVAGLSDYTDASGNYLIENVPEGSLTSNFMGTPTEGTNPLTVQFTDLSTGNTQLVTCSASGYSTYNNNQVAIPAGGSVTLDISLSPTLTGNEMRFVLNWGADPSDLDSHLRTPEIEGTAYHIYFGSQGSATSPPYATLDHDVVSGFGPETMTIYDFFTGTYYYYIYKYSGVGEITTSNAVVQVYNENGLIHTLQAPTSGTGDFWYIGTIDGTSQSLNIINVIQETEPGTGKRDVIYPEKPETEDNYRNPITSWNWNFGDGNTSTLQSPSHTYVADGNYTVSLSISDGSSTDIETKVDYIKVGPYAINEIASESVNIYPNPAEGFVQFDSKFEITQLNIYDHTGKLIVSKIVNDKSIRLNLETIKAGIYMVQVYTEESVVTKKLIIR